MQDLDMVISFCHNFLNKGQQFKFQRCYRLLCGTMQDLVTQVDQLMGWVIQLLKDVSKLTIMIIQVKVVYLINWDKNINKIQKTGNIQFAFLYFQKGFVAIFFIFNFGIYFKQATRIIYIYMNNYQLYDYKQNYHFGPEDSDESTVSKEKVQNCSILQIDINDPEPQSIPHHKYPNFTFHQLQQLSFKNTSSNYKTNHNQKISIMGKEYLTLKNWQQKRKIQAARCLKQKSHKSQRKRLLNEMIDKLDKNRKVIDYEQQVDETIVSKIENIVELLGEVEKQIKTKQKCNLGMKLKMKVDPNNRYFKNKVAQQSYTPPYTSRSKKQESRDSVYQKSKEVLSRVKKIINLQQKDKPNQRFYRTSERQYTTQNIYSSSLSQKKSKNNYLCSQQTQRSNIQHNRLRIKREQIVEKQMKRRQKLYNRLVAKK